MWLFFVLVNSIIPLMTLFIGLLFYYKPPKSINYIYGYRTSMSMKNQETWEYAHKVCGKMWIEIGMLMLLITGIIMFIFIKGELTELDDRMAIITLTQVILMVGSLFFIESKLKMKFDKEGHRK